MHVWGKTIAKDVYKCIYIRVEKLRRNRSKNCRRGPSNIGVQGSNPGRDFPNCEIFRMAKTDDSYVKIPTKTDQNGEKNVRALIGFGKVKETKTDDFFCLNSKNFSTRVTTKFDSFLMNLRD